MHFNNVTFIQGVIEDTGGVDNLPRVEVVISVTKIEGLGSEGVRLNFDISTSNLVEEGGLTDVGETTNEEGTFIRVDRRETSNVLADIFEVLESISELLAGSGHTTKSSALELLTTVQRITVLQETDVITTNGVDNVTDGTDLAEGDLVVITVIQDMHQITVEGMDIIDLREFDEDVSELFVDGLLGEFDLLHVELTNTRDVVTLVDDGRSLTLGFGKNDINKVLCGRNSSDALVIETGTGHFKKKRILK